MKDKTIDYTLRATWQAVSRMYNEEASKYDATMAVAFTLLSIDKNGTSSTLLGPSMGMEASSLTRTLKRMEDKGLIQKEKNPNDGRGVIIKLTELGVEKRNLSKEKVKQFNDTIKKNLTEQEIDTFLHVSNVINQLILDKDIFNNKK